MRKLLFLVLAAVMLGGCSVSDDEDETGETQDNKIELYTATITNDLDEHSYPNVTVYCDQNDSKGSIYALLIPANQTKTVNGCRIYCEYPVIFDLSLTKNIEIKLSDYPFNEAR